MKRAVGSGPVVSESSGCRLKGVGGNPSNRKQRSDRWLMVRDVM